MRALISYSIIVFLLLLFSTTIVTGRSELCLQIIQFSLFGDSRRTQSVCYCPQFTFSRSIDSFALVQNHKSNIARHLGLFTSRRSDSISSKRAETRISSFHSRNIFVDCCQRFCVVLFTPEEESSCGDIQTCKHMHISGFSSMLRLIIRNRIIRRTIVVRRWLFDIELADELTAE